jgi:hypothetical protein
MAARIANLQKANNAASECKGRQKKKRIQKEGTLSQAEAEDMIAQRYAEVVKDKKVHEDRTEPGAGSRGIQHYKTLWMTWLSALACESSTYGELQLEVHFNV